MQAETGTTQDRPTSGAIATRSAALRVSSHYVRREASRCATATRYSRMLTNRFAILRTRILREMRKHGWRRLAVVPLTEGAGGTTVAIQLALVISRQNNAEVILADLDLARPSVATALGIPGCDPLSEVLQRRRLIVDFTAIIEEVPNLWVVAPAMPEPGAAEILQDEGLRVALELWRSQRPSAIEIVDTAPLLGGDAALATLPMADALLLVADGRRGKAADMTRAERLLKDMPPIMGVVLNKSED